MSTEEQLQLAYAQIVDLKEVIARLESQLDPAREERLRRMYQDGQRAACRIFSLADAVKESSP